jgi:hypothetical protein
MVSKSEPWYVHAVLYVIIIALVYVLIQVAIIGPTEIIEKEKYFKTESRARMLNLREAQILWKNKNGSYTDNLDSLIAFIQKDTSVTNLKEKIDSLTGKSRYPFKPLAHGAFDPESLFWTPKSHSNYILQVDTTIELDTVVNRRGNIVRVDTITSIGNRYLLEDPDGYGKIGDLNSDALINTPSWEQ